MRVVQVILLLIGYISYTSAQPEKIYILGDNTVNATVWPEFDCRRPPAPPCFGNGKCNEGKCTCNSDFDGIDCSVNIAGGGLIPCTGAVPCDPDHGRCFRNNISVEVCSCDAGFVGDDCSIIRASVKCRPDDMLITIYPQPSRSQFRGRYGTQIARTSTISPEGSCSGNTNNPTRWLSGQRFEQSFREVSEKNPCDPFMSSTNSTTGGGVKACYDIRLQYHAGRILFTDEVFQFCCEDLANTGSNVTVGNNPVGGGATVDGTIRVINSRLEYTDTGTDVLPGSRVNLGARLSFVMSINSLVTKYDDFRVVQCYANPGNILIVDERCPNEDEQSVIRGIRRVPLAAPLNDEIHVDIYAYRGTSSNIVTLECDCLVCNNTCPVAPTCTDTQMPLGRKKRQAEDDTTDSPRETFTTSTTFIVGDPTQVFKATPVTVQAPNGCYQNTIFIAITTVFGVLLLIALIVSVFLCMRYAARGRRGSSEPTTYFNSGMTKA